MTPPLRNQPCPSCRLVENIAQDDAALADLDGVATSTRRAEGSLPSAPPSAPATPVSEKASASQAGSPALATPGRSSREGQADDSRRGSDQFSRSLPRDPGAGAGNFAGASALFQPAPVMAPRPLESPPPAPRGEGGRPGASTGNETGVASSTRQDGSSVRSVSQGTLAASYAPGRANVSSAVPGGSFVPHVGATATFAPSSAGAPSAGASSGVGTTPAPAAAPLSTGVLPGAAQGWGKVGALPGLAVNGGLFAAALPGKMLSPVGFPGGAIPAGGAQAMGFISGLRSPAPVAGMVSFALDRGPRMPGMMERVEQSLLKFLNLLQAQHKLGMLSRAEQERMMSEVLAQLAAKKSKIAKEEEKAETSDHERVESKSQEMDMAGDEESEQGESEEDSQP